MILKVVFANSVDPDQTASDLSPYCLPVGKNTGMKSLQKYSLDDNKQTTFSDAGFLGVLSDFAFDDVLEL